MIEKGNEKSYDFDIPKWSVLTIGHSLPEYYYGEIMEAFLNGSSCENLKYNINYAKEPFDIDLSCDFTSQGAMEYIGHVSGHLHTDNIAPIKAEARP